MKQWLFRVEWYVLESLRSFVILQDSLVVYLCAALSANREAPINSEAGSGTNHTGTNQLVATNSISNDTGTNQLVATNSRSNDSSKYSMLSHERGDVPGWVLVVLMTAGLVTGIWTVAAPRLNQILRTSLDSMNAIR